MGHYHSFLGEHRSLNMSHPLVLHVLIFLLTYYLLVVLLLQGFVSRRMIGNGRVHGGLCFLESGPPLLAKQKTCQIVRVDSLRTTPSMTHKIRASLILV